MKNFKSYNQDQLSVWTWRLRLDMHIINLTLYNYFLTLKGLENYYLYHTSIGEIYFEMNEKTMARKSYEKSMHLTNSQQEKQLLKYTISSRGDV